MGLSIMLLGVVTVTPSGTYTPGMVFSPTMRPCPGRSGRFWCGPIVVPVASHLACVPRGFLFVCRSESHGAATRMGKARRKSIRHQ